MGTNQQHDTLEAKELVISVEGRIVESNFDEFCEALRAKIRALNSELRTQEDFQVAEANVKALKSAEKSLTDAKKKAIEQAEDVQRLFDAIDSVGDEAQSARLGLEKQIRARKEAAREEILENAMESLNVLRKSPYRARIAEAMKGKRNLASLEDAATSEVWKIQKEVDAARKVIENHRAQEGDALLYDEERLEQMAAEDVALELSRRTDRKRQEEEQRRMRDERERKEREEREEREERARKRREEEEAASQAAPSAPAPEIPHNTGKGGPDQAEPPARNTGPTAGAPSGRPPDKAPGADVPDHGSPPRISTPEEELADFQRTIREAFAPAREARARLVHQENVVKAERFAQKLTEAWRELIGGAE